MPTATQPRPRLRGPNDQPGPPYGYYRYRLGTHSHPYPLWWTTGVAFIAGAAALAALQHALVALP